MDQEEINIYGNVSMSKEASMSPTTSGAWSAFPASQTSEKSWDFKLYMCAYRDRMF